MGGEKGRTIVARTGGATPVHKKTTYSPAYLQGGPANLKLQLDLLENKGDQCSRSRRTFKGYVEWYAAITPLLQQGYGGDVAMREALLQATAAGNAALDAAARS